MNKKNLSKALYLYAITDESANMIEKTEIALQSGITCLQYRATKKTDFTEAIALKELCHKYHVLYIINNDVQLAKQIGADGVHVGQTDMPVAEARAILGNQAVIGASVSSLTEALKAQKDGADYLGIGAIFPTPTKPEADVVSLNTLRCICTSVSIPAVAIGGIHLDNIHVLEYSGIVGISVISAIFSSSQPIPETVHNLLNTLQKTDFKTSGYSLFVCDFDGTIIDSMNIWEHLAQDFVRSFGISPQSDLDKELTNWGLRDGIIYLREAYHLPSSPEDCLKRFTDMLITRYRNCRLKDGVQEFGLYAQKHDKLLLCCATAGSDTAIHVILSEAGLLNLFEPIFSSISIGIDKSDPAFYLKLLELTGARIEGSCAFDDAPFALKSAHEAGLRTVRIQDSFWNKDSDRDIYADMTCQSLMEWVDLQSNQ